MEFLINIFLEAIVIGIFIFLFQLYLQHKFAPLTAEETLKRENYLNAKRDAYYTALSLIIRSLANTEWKNSGIDNSQRDLNKGDLPSELEVNICFSNLCLFTDDKKILSTFIEFFTTSRNTQKLSEFVNLLREDMGYNKSLLDPLQDEYKYIVLKNKF